MFEHRGVQIKFSETTRYVTQRGNVLECSSGRMFYVAESAYGLTADGFSAEDCLKNHKVMIDRQLGG